MRPSYLQGHLFSGRTNTQRLGHLLSSKIQISILVVKGEEPGGDQKHCAITENVPSGLKEVTVPPITGLCVAQQ